MRRTLLVATFATVLGCTGASEGPGAFGSTPLPLPPGALCADAQVVRSGALTGTVCLAPAEPLAHHARSPDGVWYAGPIHVLAR